MIQKLCLTPAHKNIECHANSVQTTTATHKIPGFTLLPTENGPDSTDNKTSVHHSSRLNKIFRQVENYYSQTVKFYSDSSSS